MYELRRLAHGDRPVTGQDNRKNVEEFFTRNLDPEAAASRPQDENRPEQVIVEVRGLVESRPASSILQSAGFRRNLERALRGSLATFAARQPAQPTTTRHDRPQVSRAVTSPSSMFAPGTPEMAQAARVPESNHNRISPERESVTPGSSRSSSRGNSPGQVRQSFIQQLENAHLRRQQRGVEGRNNGIPPPPPPPLPPVEPQEYAQAWLQGQVNENGNQRDQEGVSAWDDMEQAHRESIISDISDLVQRQLVTSTLDGEFRDTLELTMRGRLEASGIDGNRVQRVINQLPRIPAHMRNNFSDLGIVGPQGVVNHDNISDNVSVISATAAVTIPHTQSTAVMSREINSLKSQMMELKNMMKLSFDLQLDIQRAIRQEVSAAISGALGGGACASCFQRQSNSKPADSTKCVICLDKAADAVLYQCGHLCLCYTCGLTLRQRGSNCPVCRAPIKDIIRAFTTGNTD